MNARRIATLLRALADELDAPPAPAPAEPREPRRRKRRLRHAPTPEADARAEAALDRAGVRRR